MRLTLFVLLIILSNDLFAQKKTKVVKKDFSKYYNHLHQVYGDTTVVLPNYSSKFDKNKKLICLIYGDTFNFERVKLHEFFNMKVDTIFDTLRQKTSIVNLESVFVKKEYESIYKKDLEYLIGYDIPQFKAINFDDHVIDIDYSKMTLLHFGSLTNQKSLDAIRYLNELQEKYHDKLDIIALYTDTYEDLFRFKAYNKILYPIIPNAENIINTILKLQDMDSKCILIDKNGRVIRMLLHRDFLKLEGEFERIEEIVNAR
jgi:thiol-disulfide isomerase/thioredoxin